MPLDMFGQAQSDTNAYVQRNNAPRLPATFGDTFDAAWNENRLFGQSIAGANAREAAFSDYVDELQRRGVPYKEPEGTFTGDQYNPPDLSARMAAANIDDAELDRRAVGKSRQSRADFHEMQAREKTLGGSLGSLTGAAAGSLTDPVNLVVAPLAAPGGLGLLATAMAWAGIAGGSQAAIEAIGSPFRDEVQPGYSASGEPARNVLGAAAFGGAAGGFFKGLGMAWSRAKTGVWPRSIRDAGNVVESEAQVAQSNVLPGLEGEVAHRDALAKTIDDVVAGRKVEPPASVTTPQEPTGPGFDVFHGTPYDFKRFDMSKIGTGEGAQAYGHGLYFAEHEGVARDYATKLADRMATHEEMVSGEASDTVGNTYRVRINADREHFLDFDKPLRDQSPFVREKLQPFIDKRLAELGPVSNRDSGLVRDFRDRLKSGEMDLNRFLVELATNRADQSRMLNELGIPGIKYLDQGSRGTGEGSRNYVLFDDRLAQITHKNGEPLSLFDAHEARVDMMMDERAWSRAAAEEAKAAPVEPAPELPLETTKTEVHEATIADGVQNIARMAGHDMPREEAEKIAKMVAGASDDERARAILSAVFDRPQTVAAFPPSPLPKAREGELAGSLEPKTIDKAVASPEFEQALRADIDRARATGDVKIPAGVDDRGEPVFRSVDAAMNEIDALKAAAEQIKACANPQPEPAEAA